MIIKKQAWWKSSNDPLIERAELTNKAIVLLIVLLHTLVGHPVDDRFTTWKGMRNCK